MRTAHLDRSFFIPKDSRKETRDGIDAEVYLSDAKGYPCAMAFIAKQSKPAFHYRYRSEESRREAIDSFFDGIAKSQEYRENKRKERKEFATTLKVGDLLHGSWGYDQTNPEFAEVTAILGPRCIEITKIGMETAPDSHGYNGMAQDVVPVPGKHIGEPMRRIVSPGDHVKYNEYCMMSKTTATARHYHSWYA